MKNILIGGLVILSSLAIVTAASVKDSKKASSTTSEKYSKKTAAPVDLVYYRNIFYSGRNVNC